MLGRLLHRSAGVNVSSNVTVIRTPIRSFTNTTVLQLDAHTSAQTANPEAAAAAVAALSARNNGPVSTRTFTKATLRRQALAQSNPWYISHHALVRIRRSPLASGAPIESRLPHELREHMPEFEMRKLRHLEASILASDPQRYICPFNPGDRIVVTKYISLNDRSKFERVAGLVLARSRGDRLTASFLMRCHKLGEDYELRIPLWSPFIARIDMVQANPEGRNRRRKQYLLREGQRPSWETKLPVGMSKPTATPQSIAQRVKDNPGKILVLNHFPMKKFVVEKRGGGLGAEMAAAGADNKGGAKPAAPPGKKK
jgi:ribosomal protein L19